MSDITVDKKLQLIQQVRSQYHRNQYDLVNRERILYGQTAASYQQEPGMAYSGAWAEHETASRTGQFSSLRFRLMVALALLFGILILDMTDQEFWGLNAADIFTYLEKDVDVSTLEFMEETVP
ncbi:MAG: hypothetical protein LBQ15_09250 [Clostridium sp.]|jgi:hypothetical protein|nr:hypothetical protein [Clostridium sp.]